MNYRKQSLDVEKIKLELLEAEKKKLREQYPDDDAWRAPRNIAEKMRCVGSAQMVLNNFEQKLSCMTDTEIIKMYKPKEYEETSEKEKVIQDLRNRIIKSINETKSMEYELLSLSGYDAPRWFGRGPWGEWDGGAKIKLNLRTRKLNANVFTYPLYHGQCGEHNITLTALEFHAIAEEKNSYLSVMVYDTDWDRLFDENLKIVIARKLEEEELEEKRRIIKEQVGFGLVIPDKILEKPPKMEYLNVKMGNFGEYYDERRILKHFRRESMLVQRNGKYLIETYYDYCKKDEKYDDYRKKSRMLTPAEATWLEQQIDNVLADSDETIEESVSGKGTMNVFIEIIQKTCVESKNIKPLKKYVKLQLIFARLSLYGCITESELKQYS